MFTMTNTDGFSQDQLNELNAALRFLVDEGFDESTASDLLNNAWDEATQTMEALVDRLAIDRRAMQRTKHDREIEECIAAHEKDD
jgi:hypothetical protein